jgi:hypothetical protein
LPGWRGYPVPLKEEDYVAVAGALKASGMIDDIPAFSDFFVDCAAADEK